ncbi:IS4 family transposase [Spirochaetia bacterium]|nr:IS4 family transposase [Spirochaetia bacterium]
MGAEIDNFESLMAFMPEGWEAKAKELGALQRARNVKTAEELLKLILLYLTEGKSFAGTSALLRMGGDIELNKIGVYKRVRSSAEWLKWLCEHFYRHNGLLAEKPQWLKGKQVCLVDSSEDVICGSRKSYFRLHYCLDLFTLGMRELKVTDIKTGEALTNFANLGKNDIVIGDRGYGTMPGIRYLKEQGSGFVLRLRARAFTVYNRQGRKISLLGRLKGLKAGESRSFEVRYLHEGEYVPLRICAMRKDRDSERAGFKRLKKENQHKRHGAEVSELRSAYNRYIIVATSLAEKASASQVLELYRMRWQIELVFKRLKSLFRYNEIPVKLDQTAYAWFYGKLLLAALCERLVNEGRFPLEKKRKIN